MFLTKLSNRTGSLEREGAFGHKYNKLMYMWVIQKKQNTWDTVPYTI